MRRTPALEVGGCFALSCVFLAHAWALAVVAEDAYISFRFARNLSLGHGLVWNVGEAPVEGFTNFAWVVTAALAFALELPVELFMQGAGVVSGLGMLVLTFRIARERLGLGIEQALAATALLACSGPLAAWAGSGLETVGFAFLVLLSLHGFLRWCESGSGRGASLAFAAAFASALTRPEGAALALLFVGIGAYLARRGSRRELGRFLLRFGLWFVVPFVGYQAWRLQTFGLPFPLSYYSKTGGGLAQVARGARYALDFAMLYVLPLAPLALPALFRSIRGDGAGASAATARERPPEATALRCCAVIATAYGCYVIGVGGDYMAMFRFFVPLLPLLYLLAAALRPPRRSTHAVLVSVAAFCTLLHSTSLGASGWHAPALHQGTYRGIETERWFVSRYRAIASALAARAGPERASIGLFPFGAISFYTRWPSYTPWGLLDEKIARTGKSLRPIGEGRPGHERVDLVRMLSHRPSYVLLAVGLTEVPSRKFPHLAPEEAEIVQREYRPAAIWVDDPDNGEAGYLNLLVRRDVEPPFAPRSGRARLAQ